MAETQAAPSNKLVRFRGRPTHEFARLQKRGLISDRAARKALKKFGKKAGHNPPKPQFSERAVASGSAPSQRDILKRWESGMEMRQQIVKDPEVSAPRTAPEAAGRARNI